MTRQRLILAAAGLALVAGGATLAVRLSQPSTEKAAPNPTIAAAPAAPAAPASSPFERAEVGQAERLVWASEGTRDNTAPAEPAILPPASPTAGGWNAPEGGPVDAPVGATDAPNRPEVTEKSAETPPPPVVPTGLVTADLQDRGEASPDPQPRSAGSEPHAGLIAQTTPGDSRPVQKPEIATGGSVSGKRYLHPHEPDDNRFANRPDSPWSDVATTPSSTFSADVDTASYSLVRRFLQSGQLPPPNAVRTEELLNYFDYEYGRPTDGSPFAPTVALYPAPWASDVHVLHIGIQAVDDGLLEAPPVNVVLLVDVSGSMNRPDRLPLAQSAFSLLVAQLRPSDTVGIVTYAAGVRVALAPTPASERDTILNVINGLRSGGSTAGAAGLQKAYELARERYNPRGINRIFLATDGDFNVGVSSPGGVAAFVASQRSSGVFLSVLGFGMGNLQDRTMQAIAQNGNGVAAYIDSLAEARRVLVDQVGKTLVPVAKDVKFQVEFNPARVRSYRLLGYETRALSAQDFANDKVDAGDVGSGHQVTALYEVRLASDAAPEPSRYAPPTAVPDTAKAAELAFLRLRYKRPDAAESELRERPITPADSVTSLDAASSDVRWAAAVSAFSRLLRHPDAAREITVTGSRFGFGDIERLAAAARGNDPLGTRAEFVELVRKAEVLVSGGRLRGDAGDNGNVAFPP